LAPLQAVQTRGSAKTTVSDRDGEWGCAKNVDVGNGLRFTRPAATATTAAGQLTTATTATT
jgi:hypothetical protein